MPVKQRRPKVRAQRITPEAVEAFRKGMEIFREGSGNEWEDKGGRRQELLDADSALCRALGLKLWQQSPLFAFHETPPDWMTREDQLQDWANAWALRQELERA